MFAAGRQQAFEQATAGGNGDAAVPGRDQGGGYFEGGTFNAAAVQGRQQLDDGEAAHGRETRPGLSP
ncbi:hypothetical protein GCM10011521_26950 [Arenimonas soli]|uniref:Stress-induced protein n=1 Tax=Arenimonas soli TaxID=2269504 RepID=A0ABQ1HRC4_9GAMM|nr:hypothetical protein GCM10011521_26950 [Arenimonas soli]